MNTVHLHGSGASRRAFLRTAASAGTVLGTGLLTPTSLVARDDADDRTPCVRPNPIPGKIAPFAPFGIFIHHRPPNPGAMLANIDEPSQITDFKGFVGVTRIRGAGTGINTATGATMSLAFQADMGFNQGLFVGTDGRRHRGTFGFV